MTSTSKTKMAAYATGLSEYRAEFPFSSKCRNGRSGSPDRHSSGSKSNCSTRHTFEGMSEESVVVGDCDREANGDEFIEFLRDMVSGVRGVPPPPPLPPPRAGLMLLVMRTVGSLDETKPSRSMIDGGDGSAGTARLIAYFLLGWSVDRRGSTA
jgi:hypothetical protein